VSERRSTDTASGVLLVIATLLALGSLGYKPFLLAPIAVVSMCAGLVASGKFRHLALATALLLTVCFVAGATVAVWYSRSIY
jgi:hypothetical protein